MCFLKKCIKNLVYPNSLGMHKVPGSEAIYHHYTKKLSSLGLLEMGAKHGELKSFVSNKRLTEYN